jgi:molybdate transport system regulatory protein
MPQPPSAELWIKVTLPDGRQLGPGKIALLRKIREHESISGAARAMKMSYRRAWLLVADLNQSFARPLVETWAGGKTRGGATLTKLGERIVESYEEVVAQAVRVNRSLLAEIARNARRDAADES